MLGTRSKRKIEELSLGLPDNFIEMAYKKVRTFHYSYRRDGSKLNPFASPIRGSFATFIPDSFFSPVTKQNISTALNSLPNARPATFSDPSPGGRPKKAITPRKTRYSRHADFGSLLVFLPDLEDSQILDVDKKDICDTILNFQEKEFSFSATPQGLIEASKQTRSSQAAVAGMSAKEAAKNSGFEFPKKQFWNWMHLIAFFMKGRASQTKENLVVGTRDANIRHLFAELEVPYLLEFFPSGVKVFGKVLVDDNNVGKTLEYNIATDDFTLKFTFDLQSLKRPNQIEGECIHKIVEVMMERSKEKKRQTFTEKLAGEQANTAVSTGL